MVTLDDAKEVSKSLVKEISPVSVIVFGSVARSGKGSDLDLFIVTEEEDRHDDVNRCLRDFYKRFALDFIVVSYDKMNKKFREGSHFLRLVQKEGRVLYMKDAIREWIGLSFEDLKQARYLYEGGFYRGSCFSAQQSVEKAIKAELLKRGWELEKIHNIRRLINISTEFNLYLMCKDEDMDFMDSIYRGRYPAEEGLLPLKNPTREDASRAISIAEGIFRKLNMIVQEE